MIKNCDLYKLTFKVSETIIKNKIDKKIAFPRWPSEFPAIMCRPVCLGGLTGRHWLAGNSESHRGISKFLFLMVP